MSSVSECAYRIFEWAYDRAYLHNDLLIEDAHGNEAGITVEEMDTLRSLERLNADLQELNEGAEFVSRQPEITNGYRTKLRQAAEAVTVRTAALRRPGAASGVLSLCDTMADYLKGEPSTGMGTMPVWSVEGLTNILQQAPTLDTLAFTEDGTPYFKESEGAEIAGYVLAYLDTLAETAVHGASAERLGLDVAFKLPSQVWTAWRNVVGSAATSKGLYQRLTDLQAHNVLPQDTRARSTATLVALVDRMSSARS